MGVNVKKISETFAKVVEAVRKKLKISQTPIENLLIVVVTSLLNQVFTKNFFSCPNKKYTTYSLMFMLGPAAPLYLIGLIMSKEMNTVFTGACKAGIDAPEYGPWGKRKRTWKYLARQLALSVAKSSLAPICWIVLALLYKEMYSCAKVGPKPTSTTSNTANISSIVKAYEVSKNKADAESQIIGWAILIGTIAFAVTVFCIKKCCFTDPPEKDLLSMRKYEKLEAKSAYRVFEKHMEEAARLNGTKRVHKMFGIKDCHCTEEPKEEEASKTVKEPKEEASKTVKEPKEEESSKTVKLKGEPPSYEEIYDARVFMALKYPRLDNPDNTALPYYNREKVCYKDHLAPAVEITIDPNYPDCPEQNMIETRPLLRFDGQSRHQSGIPEDTL